MAAHQSLKRKRPTAQPDKEPTVTTQTTKVKDRLAHTKTRAEERTGQRTDEPLANAKKASRVTQERIKHKRRARIQAEEALTQAAIPAAPREVEQERQAQVRRTSFVVRLTVDEQGQFSRTEIEHVDSGKKQNYLTLDGERLVAFMKACISPDVIPEQVIPAALPAEKGGVPTPELLKPKSSLVVSDVRAVNEEKEKTNNMERPKSSLVVSDVRVFRPETPDLMALILTAEEPFAVQARFQLQGSDAHSLTAKDLSYEMKVYANEAMTGKGILLVTYHTKSFQDVAECTAIATVPGIPAGLYRLFIHVTLGAPMRLIGHHDGPVIRVI